MESKKVLYILLFSILKMESVSSIERTISDFEDYEDSQDNSTIILEKPNIKNFVSTRSQNITPVRLHNQTFCSIRYFKAILPSFTTFKKVFHFRLKWIRSLELKQEKEDVVSIVNFLNIYSLTNTRQKYYFHTKRVWVIVEFAWCQIVGIL